MSHDFGGSFYYDRSQPGGLGSPACAVSALPPNVPIGTIEAIATAINTIATILFNVFNLKSPPLILNNFLYYKFLCRTYKPLLVSHCYTGLVPVFYRLHQDKSYNQFHYLFQ